MVVKLFFSVSISPNVKNYLPIFILDNQFFRFYKVTLFQSNQHFALRLWPHFDN